MSPSSSQLSPSPHPCCLFPTVEPDRRPSRTVRQVFINLAVLLSCQFLARVCVCCCTASTTLLQLVSVLTYVAVLCRAYRSLRRACRFVEPSIVPFRVCRHHINLVVLAHSLNRRVRALCAAIAQTSWFKLRYFIAVCCRFVDPPALDIYLYIRVVRVSCAAVPTSPSHLQHQ